MKATKSFVKCLMAIFVMVMAFSVTGITAKAEVKQTALNKNSITVTWPAEKRALEYYVGIGTDYNSAYAAMISKAITLSAEQTSYTFTELTEGTRYYVRVRCKYTWASGKNTYTSEKNVGPTVIQVKTLPGKVTGLIQTKWWYYLKNVDFEWNDQPAVDYEIVIKNNKNKVISKDSRVKNTSRFSKVKNNQMYKAQVRAYVTINGQKCYGPYSDTTYLFTQPMVKKAKVKRGKLNITWGKISGATGYDVYVSMNQWSGYKKVKSVSKSKGSLTVKKFKGKKFRSNKKYYVYVVAKKKVGKKTYTSGRHCTFEAKKGKLNWTFDK